MRLKLDENVGRTVQSLLEGAGHDVDTVLDEELAGAADDAVLAAAVEDERALVTFDLGFANPFRFDPTGTSGIAVLRLPKSPDASQIKASSNGSSRRFATGSSAVTCGSSPSAAPVRIAKRGTTDPPRGSLVLTPC